MISIIYIMGVSGSGKTTVGKKLSETTGIPFFDADDFHSVANKNKMNAGHPLNDDDRKEWLQNINEKAKEEAEKKRGNHSLFCIERKLSKSIGQRNNLPRLLGVFTRRL